MKITIWLCALVLTACATAPAVDDTAPASDGNLSAVVAQFTEEDSPQYQHALVDLDNDGTDDALVLLEGMGWCGSGGCTMLVLKGTNAGYVVVSNTTVTRAPLRVSKPVSNGWRDLIVHSDDAERLMQFDGDAYPPNPSMQPSATKAQIDSAEIILP